MKKHFLFLFFYLCLWCIKGQTINLVWKGSTPIETGYQGTKEIPNLENYKTDIYNGSIFLTIDSPNPNAKIINPVWEKINVADLYSLSAGDLPSRDIFDAASTNKNGKLQTQFFISVFKRSGDDLFRLQSFSIGQDANSPTIRSATIRTLAATTTNPLAQGTFYKIKVDKSGIFKITSKFLRDNGINPSTINPANFRIYGNGGVMLPEDNRDPRFPALQEDAIQVVGGEDGKWDEGDYALFYAQGPDGFNLYKSGIGYTGNKRMETRTDTSLNLKNIYEDYSYYYINFDIGPGKRVQPSDVVPPSSLITDYDAYQFINEEKNNLMHVGRIWVGDVISNSKTITFNTDAPIPSGSSVTVNTRVVGFNAPLASLTQTINGGNQNVINISSMAGSYTLAPVRKTLTNVSGNSISIVFTPNIAGNPSASFYFDYAEVVYKQPLTFNGSQMNFREYAFAANNLYGFQMNNSAGADQVWDITDITTAKSVVNKGDSTNFIFGYQNSTSNSNEFVAFKNSAALDLVGFVGKINNQNLSGLSGIDYLIITQSDMIPQAQRLADYHKATEGFQTAIVTPQQIYNEFSSGSQDITAIRDFVTKLKNQGSLKYVLILGDGSYDYKNRISSNTNIVPTYESEASSNFEVSFATDDYFVQTRPQTSTVIYGMIPDLPIGRLPAANVSEAKTLIDKTMAYYNALSGQASPFGDWRMKTAFVVDDDKSGSTPFHNTMEATLQKYLGVNSPIPEYNVQKLYLDAFTVETTAGGQRYPQVTQAINSFMNNGLFLYYFGHGGINGWSQKRVLTTQDIQNFNNFNNAFARFPLVSTITCEFTLWDDPQTVSAGELLMKLPAGGAATMITSSRALSVSYGVGFTDIFIKDIMALQGNGNFRTLGDAFLQARNDYGTASDHLRVNFLGDPAMTLARPKKLITDVTIKSNSTAATSDLTHFNVRALDFITITGKVTKDGTNVDGQYNGKIAVDIYDKPVAKSTRNNSGQLSPVLNYQEEGAPIVRTTGVVKDGLFTIQFYVPKDINYTLGQGRLLLYADNWTKAGDNSHDAFFNSPTQVGGLNPDGVNDNTPPAVNLFMNNTNFADGGITNQNPTLLACVTDDTGINSSGSGIGHDITAVLDGDVVDTFVLNDFYTAGSGNGCASGSLQDYQKGSVSFPFSNLAPGPHQLVFKVWDINNNSATSTLNFVVTDDQDQNLTIKRLLNWPNPFTDKTYIQFETNCSSVLEVNAQIYTITGKLVRSLHDIVSAEPFREGFRTPRTAIEWDGLDDFGSAVGKGTYIYKVFVKAENGDLCKGSATAVEKMVILK